MSYEERWSRGIDTEAIRKGDVISRERFAAIMGLDMVADHYEIQYAGVAFRGWLARQLEARDYPCTICESKGDTLILTDAEALRYNDRAFRKGNRRMRQANRRASQIDAGNLTREQRQARTRTLQTQGLLLQAIAEKRREIRAEAVRRRTPGLLAN